MAQTKFQQLESIVNSWWHTYPDEMRNELTIFYDNQKRKEIVMNKKRLQELIVDMYWDFDRLSSNGKLALEKIAELAGVPTEKEMNAKSKEELLEDL